MRFIAFAVYLLLLAGCSETSYSTYTKCRLIEEQKGASQLTSHSYCKNLAEKGKIQCDSWECE